MPAQYFQIEAPRTCRLSEGENHPPSPRAKEKKERVRAGEMEKEEIVITNQTEGDSRSSHFSCDHVCLRFSFRDVTL